MDWRRILWSGLYGQKYEYLSYVSDRCCDEPKLNPIHCHYCYQKIFKFERVRNKPDTATGSWGWDKYMAYLLIHFLNA